MENRQSLYIMDSITNCVSYISRSTTPTNNPQCRKCGQACALSCLRCGEFYCSTTCQDQDWPDHRGVCMPKPPLIKIDVPTFKIENFMQLKQQFRMLASVCEDFAKQLENNEEKASNAIEQDHSPQQLSIKDETVVLSSFSSLNTVFVCHKNNWEEYKAVLKQVDEYGQKLAVPLKELPERNTLVLSRNAGKFCRAKVLEIIGGSPVNIRLSYIDYGTHSVRQLFELREISYDIAQLPIFVAAIKLKNVRNTIIAPSAWNSIVNAFERETCIMKTDESDEAELFLDTGENLNQKLLSIIHQRNVDGKTHSPLQQQLGNKVESPNLKKLSISEDTAETQLEEVEKKVVLAPVMNEPFQTNVISRAERNVKAVIVDNSMVEHGYIACVLLKHAKDFNDILTFIKEKEFAKAEPYVPKNGEYVIADYRGEWYRAQVVGVQTDKDIFEVFYVDFLNHATVSSSQIRHYPEDLTIDCNTQLCAFNGLPKKITEEVKMFLKDKIHVMEKILIDRVVDIDGDVVIIECRQILDGMLEKNLI